MHSRQDACRGEAMPRPPSAIPSPAFADSMTSPNGFRKGTAHRT